MDHPVYLSRLQLNTRDRRVRKDLSDCHAMHRALMSVFPSTATPGEPRAFFGLLYRLESVPVGHLLVQSQALPDWSALPLEYLATNGNRATAVETKRVDDTWQSVETGQRLRFRLRANPTKRVGDKDSPAYGKRVELVREEEQIDWLIRRGTTGGFRLSAVQIQPTVPSVRTSAMTKAVGHRKDRTGRRERLTFGSVLFEGALEVTDRSAFLVTLSKGVGPGKAYGFGLLSVAPERWR